MSRAWSVPLALLLALVTLSGCIGGEDKVEKKEEVVPDECIGEGDAKFCSEAVLDETGRDLRTGLVATDTLNAPVWAVGDIFEQHVYYGSKDSQGEHIVTMVVDDSGDCYQFGTTSKVAAANDVVFDLPVLGCVGKEHLETSALGIDWDWMYEFPLTDNKTWSAKLEGLFNWNQNSFHNFDVTLVAKYHAAIDTPTGNFPGFEITGTTPDGQVLLLYNYVPAVGWFSHFWMYDITTDLSDDVMFHAMSMGTGKGYTGKYFLNTAETVVEQFWHPIAVPFQPTVAGNALSRFNVKDGLDYLKGVVVPFACPGSSKVVLVEPDNTYTQHDHSYNGDPQKCMEAGDGNPVQGQYSVSWWDSAAQPGDWTITVAGAGIYGYYLWLMGVDEVEYELPPADAVKTAA